MVQSKTEGATIRWTVAMREQLRGAYDRAVKNKRDEFMFLDHVMLTAYAKYLIMHLDNTLGE